MDSLDINISEKSELISNFLLHGDIHQGKVAPKIITFGKCGHVSLSSDLSDFWIL